MSAEYTGPENGAADHSLWEPETVRPLGVVRAERERARQESETDTPSSENDGAVPPGAALSALVPAAPAFPILPPDEYEILKRLEKLEAAVANQESVIAMCVYVATTAADRAKGGVG